MRILLVAVLAAIVAGCAGAEPERRLTGTFTESATQDDLADFGRRMSAHGGDAAILESFPPQFVVSGLSESGCAEARAEATTLAYVARVGACFVPDGGDPETPTATPA